MMFFLKSAVRLVAIAVAAFAISGVEAPRPVRKEPAKNLFGKKALPAALPAKSYGFYSKGCFSGGVAIATDGPTWQAMRLSRNRRWGHPTMIALIEKLSRAAVADGWPACWSATSRAAQRTNADQPCLAPDRARCRHLARRRCPTVRFGPRTART